MNKSQKIIACLTLVCFVVLYAFGWLWPLVRIVLSTFGFASLVASLYFAGIVVIAHFKKRDDQVDHDNSSVVRAAFSAVATLLLFAMLAVVPAPSGSGDAAPSDIQSGSQSADEDRASSRGRESTAKNDRNLQGGENASPSMDSTASKQQVASKPESKKPVSDFDPASQAAAEFLGALLGASAEQQRRQQSDPRYQQFKQSLDRLSVCPRCGGAGQYRYVDGSGTLQVQNCPSCFGSGRAN
ncbi:hypothetical protein [Roseiconus lacunae]|uniref:Uncharacterized protein n=1 Tax=Roseiconus lacunae TaxID=2605694 RepID=A0ABT7PFQ4_9BACT|nr:hypothetical protein [Roseiconus lacunae]MDM4015139.1 hypothetical protein [Roseiconus lacunae]